VNSGRWNGVPVLDLEAVVELHHEWPVLQHLIAAAHNAAAALAAEGMYSGEGSEDFTDDENDEHQDDGLEYEFYDDDDDGDGYYDGIYPF
jgi:hypothetical protein